MRREAMFQFPVLGPQNLPADLYAIRLRKAVPLDDARCVESRDGDGALNGLARNFDDRVYVLIQTPIHDKQFQNIGARDHPGSHIQVACLVSAEEFPCDPLLRWKIEARPIYLNAYRLASLVGGIHLHHE